MRAIVYEKYGAPEVLQLRELPRPEPRTDEVLIRNYATSVTAVDCIFRQGMPKFSRLFTGLTKPKSKQRVLGDEFAGEVVAVGSDVKKFKPGDRVFGSLAGNGGYAEYLCYSETKFTIAHMPSNTSFVEAVSCDGFLTALPFLRDTGHLQRGQQVLINGASGSVGSAAVQVARYLGAEVTGVCSTANLEMVNTMGADYVFDYTREDFTKSGLTYDIIFDTVGKLTFSRCKRALKPRGIFLEAAVDLSILPTVLWTALFSGKKLKIAATGLRPPAERTKDLILLRELMEQGAFKPVLDRTYPLEQIAEAHRYVDAGHKKGNVAITID